MVVIVEEKHSLNDMFAVIMMTKRKGIVIVTVAGVVPIILKSIAILWYYRISKYCNTYCKILQVLSKVLQNVLQKFPSIAKNNLLNFDW